MNYSYCCRASSNWYIRFNTPQWHWIDHSKRKICIVKINHSQDLLKKPTCVSNVLQDKYRNLQMSLKQSLGVKTVIMLEKKWKTFGDLITWLTLWTQSGHKILSWTQSFECWKIKYCKWAQNVKCFSVPYLFLPASSPKCLESIWCCGKEQKLQQSEDLP